MDSYLKHAPRAPATHAFVLRLLDHFGDVPLSTLDQTAVDRARAALFRPGVSPATVRRGLFTPLTAILNHASHPARRWCDPPRFDVPPATLADLAAMPNRAGRVFLTHRGQPYRHSLAGGGQVKRAWRTATKALPAGFTPHDLRHSWASWHYAVHRDLLRLKADGGWSQVRMCERYAHIMPAGYEDAIRAVWNGTPATRGAEVQPSTD